MYLVLAINSVTSSNSASWTAWHGSWSIVTPVRSTLAVWAIPSHVAGVATDTTDDVSREVALLRAIIFAMTNLTACQGINTSLSIKIPITYSSGMLDFHHHEGYR